MFSLSIIIRLPKNKPIRKPNLYLGYTPAKRANPIRLVMNLGGKVIPQLLLSEVVSIVYDDRRWKSVLSPTV